MWLPITLLLLLLLLLLLAMLLLLEMVVLLRGRSPSDPMKLCSCVAQCW
jgi:hypothetical protein